MGVAVEQRVLFSRQPSLRDEVVRSRILSFFHADGEVREDNSGLCVSIIISVINILLILTHFILYTKHSNKI